MTNRITKHTINNLPATLEYVVADQYDTRGDILRCIVYHPTAKCPTILHVRETTYNDNAAKFLLDLVRRETSPKRIGSKFSAELQTYRITYTSNRSCCTDTTTSHGYNIEQALDSFKRLRDCAIRGRAITIEPIEVKQMRLVAV